MLNSFRFIYIIAVVVSILTIGGCASQPQVDPIFQAVPGGRYACETDTRNPVVRGATGTVGQAALGGALGGLIGHQFGSHSGQDIATGVGAATGVAAGAWNANRMNDRRYAQCQQRQSANY